MTVSVTTIHDTHVYQVRGKWHWNCPCGAADGNHPRRRDADDAAAKHEDEARDARMSARTTARHDAIARRILAGLVEYEANHPNDAICLGPVLAAARASVPRA